MGVVVADAGVVAADQGHGAAQHAGLHALDQRDHGVDLVHVAVGDAVQALLDGLDGVADGGVGLQLGNVNKLGLAVLEVANGHLHDLLRVLAGSRLIELDVVGIGHPGDGRGGHELGVEALGQGAEGGEDALHVHDDGLAGAGQHDVFLLQEVAGHGNAVAHGDLVGGAADARHVDALRTHFLGQGDHLGILRVEHHQTGRGRGR